MGNLNPYYNESFVFIVEQEQLRVTNFVEMVFTKATTREHTKAVIFIVGGQNVLLL